MAFWARKVFGTPGLDLFPVVPDSTLPRFVNSQLICLVPVGVLNNDSVKFELFISHYQSGMHVN